MARIGFDGRRGGGREGFLLVEALSALAISALLITALLSFTGMLRRSADRTALRVETLESSNRTVWTIASEVRQAARTRWAPEQRDPSAGKPDQTGRQQGGRDPRAAGRGPAEADGEEQTGGRAQAQGEPQGQKQPDRNFVFSGAPDRLIFALAAEQADGLRAPVMVAYQIDASGAVLRAEGGIRPEDKGPEAVRLGAVMRVDPGPERLRFAYVDKDPTGLETIIDAWTETRRMPVAVRIDRQDPATGVVTGSLRVPILLSGEPGCADPDMGFCSRVAKTDPKDAGGQPGGRPAGGRPAGGGGGEPE